jgi:co-chaperonin GroES (HSP10)
VPTSLIDSLHDELCVHKKQKNEQNSKTGISTTAAKLTKNPHRLIFNDVGDTKKQQQQQKKLF